jgi:polynucleotide 5'-kinase involved in rRNA processing
VIVLGATDVGKSTFIRASLVAVANDTRLIDLDPGQKMLGAPGTASLGWLDGRGGERLDRFVFLGSTSATMFSAIASAAAALAERSGPFIVNTSGFVQGLGARLQAMTMASIAPDLIVELGNPAAPPIVTAEGVERIRLERSPVARSKSAAARAAIRQAAFERALEGASLLTLPRPKIEPAPPSPFLSDARPVCALADEAGADMEIGILEGSDEEGLFIRARAPARPPRLVRLGRMWAAPGNGWKLLETLSPSWIA